ncbi:MAG: putative quinol monooxygenase [Candidatus Zipacnadales bacterium]
MIKLIARLRAKPGCEGILTEALLELARPSREEAACILYDVYRVRDDPAQLLVLEEWESQADLDTHLETPHFKAFLARAKKALEGEPLLEFIERL